jgi:hypothetical protein
MNRPNPTLILASGLLALIFVAIGFRHLSPPGGDSADAVPGVADSLRQHPPARPHAKDGQHPDAVTGALTDQPSALADKLRDILSSGDLLERNRALLTLLDHLPPGDIPHVLDTLRELGLHSDSSEFAMFLEAWAALDRPAALAYAGDDAEAVKTVLTRWAVDDPAAALAWLLGRTPPDSGMHPLLPMALGELARRDLPAAMQTLAGLSAPDQAQAVYRIAPAVAEQGSGALQRWVGSVADPDLRTIAAVAAIQAAARFADAADLLQRYPAAASANLAAAVYRLWAGQEPAAAQASFESLPPGELHQAALQGLIQQLDPAAALALLNRYPADVNDSVLERWVNSSGSQDPALALSQLSRIQDPGARDRSYHGVLRLWQQSDPAAAQAWLSTHSAPE